MPCITIPLVGHSVYSSTAAISIFLGLNVSVITPLVSSRPKRTATMVEGRKMEEMHTTMECS